MNNRLTTLCAVTLASLTLLGATQDVAPGPAAPQGGVDKPARPDRPRRDRTREAVAPGAKIGEKAPDFTLTGVDGKTYSLKDYAGKMVVLEWVNPGCPVCRAVMEEGRIGRMIQAVKANYPDAVFLMINSNNPAQNDPKTTADYLAKHKVDGIGLIDADGKVGHLYGAKTTPQLFVIDPSGNLRYGGALDDENEGERSGSAEPAANYVVKTVQAIKDGKEVSPSTTKSYGCSVKYQRAN